MSAPISAKLQLAQELLALHEKAGRPTYFTLVEAAKKRHNVAITDSSLSDWFKGRTTPGDDNFKVLVKLLTGDPPSEHLDRLYRRVSEENRRRRASRPTGPAKSRELRTDQVKTRPTDEVAWARNLMSLSLTRRRVADSENRGLADGALIAEICGALDHEWATTVKSQASIVARKLRRAKSTLPRHKQFVDGIEAIRWTDSYVLIVEHLRRLDLQDVVAQLNQSKDAANKDVLRATAFLRSECASPRFRSGQLVLGSWGSGKSRLLTEVAKTIEERGQWFLFLDRARLRGSVDDWFLTTASEQFGRSLSTTRDFVNLTIALDISRLVVLADDIDGLSEDQLISLTDLVEKISGQDRVKWVFTADLVRLDALSSRYLSRFWLEHGAQRVDDDPGWVELDERNRLLRTGFKILELNARDSDRVELSTIEQDAAAYGTAIDLLQNPLPAWMQLASRQQSVDQWIADVYRREFIDTYWNAFVRKVSNDDQVAFQVNQMITYWARHLFTAEDHTPEYSHVIGQTLAGLGDASLNHERLLKNVAILRDNGLISIPRSGDPVVENPTSWITPTMDVLWGYRIARTIIHDAQMAADPSDEIFRVLVAWGRIARQDSLAETVVQFGLGLLPWTAEERATTYAVWQAWAEHKELPDVPLQISVSFAPATIESRVIEGIRKRRRAAQKTKRELFMLLRFAGNARSDHWRGEQRLRTLQPHYGEIGEMGLGHFAAFTVSRILKRSDLVAIDNALPCVKALADSEEGGFASTAAKAMVSRLSEFSDGEVSTWLREIARFLEVSQAEKNGGRFFPDKPDDAKRRVNDVDVDFRLGVQGSEYFYWEHLLRYASQAAVAAAGVKAFDEFTQAGLLDRDSALRDDVLFRTRVELTIAMGPLYRNPDNRANISTLITQLMAGEALNLPRPVQRSFVFFLIRHSEVTEGHLGVRVQEGLVAPLRIVCRDPDVWPFIKKWAHAMAEANGFDIPHAADQG